MPSDTTSGVGSQLMTLPRTEVPPQSTTAATKGTGTPGAAKVTMVNDRTMPSVARSTFSNVVFEQLAHALRRSKNRALHEVH